MNPETSLTGESLARAVTEWIKKVHAPPLMFAVPVELALACQPKKPYEKFYGCEYASIREVAAGCRAYDEGRRTSIVHQIFVVGEAPKEVEARKRVFRNDPSELESKFLWRRQGDQGPRKLDRDTDWFLVLHCSVKGKQPEWFQAYGEHHPFGSTFAFGPWHSGYEPQPADWKPADYFSDPKPQRKEFFVTPYLL